MHFPVSARNMPSRASLPRRHRGPRRRKSDPYAGTPRFSDEQCRYAFTPDSGDITTWEHPHLFYNWSKSYVHVEAGPKGYQWFRPMTPQEQQAIVIRKDTGEQLPASRLVSYSQITATLVYYPDTGKADEFDPFGDLFGDEEQQQQRQQLPTRPIVATATCQIVIAGGDSEATADGNSDGDDDSPEGDDSDDTRDSEPDDSTNSEGDCEP